MGRWIAGILIVAALGGGATLHIIRAQIPDLLHALFASGAEGEIAGSPAPRTTAPQSDAATAGNTLTEMPALVPTDTADPDSAPEAWPALPPSALLDQAGAAGDRALKETAFDQPPWRRFARPFAPPAGRPLIGIVVAGLGEDRAVTAAAIAGLPAEATLSFSPYAPDLAEWVAAARAFGHEALVDLPLQAKDGRALGALGLMTALNADETGRRMSAVAAAAGPVFGFAGIGGDALLLDDRAADIVLAESARHGLAFIDASGEPMSLAGAAAQTGGAAFAHAAVTVDEAPSRAAIAERLAVAVDLANRNGATLLAVHAAPEAIIVLADWARRLGESGPVLAPASALLKTP